LHVSAPTLAPVIARPSSFTDQLEPLRSRLAGQLLTADSAGYDAARTTINGSDRFPLAIVHVANVDDVVATVDFARDHSLPLAVRSGGHSLGGYSVVTDAVVVDFSTMKAVTVDPDTRTARVQAGATSGDLAGPAAAHGLAVSTCDTHSVGIGGLTTGGGIGFMVRKHGLTIDNLLEAQVVTAGGEILTASADENADLFWAIRGGGGNVGVITEFTFRLASVPQVLGGALILPATREVIRGYLDYSVSAPDDLTTIANLVHLPPVPFVPAERVGEPVLLVLVTWSGDIEAGQQALAPLRALAEPVVDVIAPMPYPAMYQLTADQVVEHAASVRNMFADDLSDTAIDAMLAAIAQSSSPMSVVQLRGLGGAYGRVANDATAFAHRERKLLVSILNIWFDVTEDRASHEAWTDALWETLRPEGAGVYVNFLEREGPDRVREAYPGGTYEQLQAIKAKYDPENLFRFNQNIPPKA
jgi:FAD/FMN-containing dehydrogenase